MRIGKSLTSIIALAVTLALTASYSAVPIPRPDTGDTLWIAESDRGIKLARADGSLLFEIPQTGRIEALAVDDPGERLWAYGDRTLRAYTFSGKARIEIPIATRHIRDDDSAPARGLTLDPSDGSVWLGLERTLHHYSREGQPLQQVTLGQTLRGLSFDPTRGRLWVATRKALTAYDGHGQRAGAITPKDHKNIRALAYDPHADALWVGFATKTLRRYDPVTGAVEIETSLAKNPGRLVADREGRIWIASGPHLLKLDGTGAPRLALKPFASEAKKHIVAVLADPLDSSVWIASAGAVRRVTASGELRPPLALGAPLEVRALALYSDLSPPILRFEAPLEGSLLNEARPTLVLHYDDRGLGVDTKTLRLENDGLALSCTFDSTQARCTPLAGLAEGRHRLQATIADFHANRSETARLDLAIDTVPPEIRVHLPASGTVTNHPEITLSGVLSEEAALLLDGRPVPLAPDLSFSRAQSLREGVNRYTLSASDSAGNTTSTVVEVRLDTVAPSAPAVAAITLGPSAQDLVTVSGAPGSVEALAEIMITNTRTGDSVSVGAAPDGSFTARIAAAPGDRLQIVVTDGAGNTSAATPVTVSNAGPLPPDPATVAPPLAETEITPLYEATAFVYSGANPIQTGVAEGTIEPRRAAVVRGQMLSRDNQPLSGVTVTIKDHPEFGETRSRADGRFDMAVNGGGLLTVNYEKSGHLPVQRQIQTPWQDFAIVEGVVMVPLDARVTTINLAGGTAMQVAQGSLTTDIDGQRRATVLFPQGTAATMILPDGTTQALSTLHVRATEYTVGANGPKAMPGPLPPTSGYTYAVELSVDEAIAAGAKRVDFNQPLPVYIDNFLDFPVGGIVPVGWYDRDKAAWIPANNGRIIKSLGVADGLAQLDVDGSGNTAGATQLAQLGITDSERARLAQLYPPGKTLWRVAVGHFTPWDFNWPYGPPVDVEWPPRPEEDDDPPPDDDSDECEGCSINPQAQALGEEIPVTGTPYTLHYQSRRAQGHKPDRVIDIPVSGATVPATLQGIDLSVTVSGKTFTQAFPPEANQSYQFEWDGLDAYGRPVVGGSLASIIVSYSYNMAYYSVRADFERSFAVASSSAGTTVIGRREVAALVVDRRWQESLSAGVPSAASLGAWSFDVHHAYDPVRRVLHRGGGTRRSPDGTSMAITTVAGIADSGYSGDGGPATNARLFYPTAIAPAGDGGFYIADTDNHRIRRVGPDGRITTVAGNGIRRYSGDGGPATEASLYGPLGIALGGDGSLYIAD
jgi:sugar lactone lactonase YvrE